MKTSKTCLLIDDDADDQEFFLHALTQIASDTFCIAASGANTAMSLLKQNKYQPDYIFLDLNLPEMNGFEFLELIKKDPDFKNIPVIIYSTSSLSNQKEKGISLGAAGFFTKSIRLNDVCTMLRGYF
jgi:CheY-like chemotaxis protein